MATETKVCERCRDAACLLAQIAGGKFQTTENQIRAVEVCNQNRIAAALEKMVEISLAGQEAAMKAVKRAERAYEEMKATRNG